MKKTTIALAALAFSGAVLAGGPDPMVAPAPAAQDNMYLGFHASMTSDFSKAVGSNTYTAGAMRFNEGGFQVGMMFGAIRAEVDAGFSVPLASTGTTLSPHLGVMIRGAYDLQLGHGLAVYPLAGIGLVHFFEGGPTATSQTNFAWQLGAGATMSLNDKTSISGEYTYSRDTAGAGTLATGQQDFGQNAFSLRWNRTF